MKLKIFKRQISLLLRFLEHPRKLDFGQRAAAREKDFLLSCSVITVSLNMSYLTS